jgi:hypothetical protein
MVFIVEECLEIEANQNNTYKMRVLLKLLVIISYFYEI